MKHSFMLGAGLAALLLAGPAEAQNRRARSEIGDANAAALQGAREASLVGALHEFAFQAGALYAVQTSPQRITDIALEPGENLMSVSAGDTTRWIVGDARSGVGRSSQAHVLVKPNTASLSTNLIIMTDRRVYHVELRSVTGPAMAAVSWRYPDDLTLNGIGGPIAINLARLRGGALPVDANDTFADDLSAGGPRPGDGDYDSNRDFPDERAEIAQALNAEPPPPLSIRTKGPGPRGLNKPAIIGLVGGATTLVLVLAASGLSSRPGGAASEARPLMSDPARQEMAQNRVRDLPRTYDEAATFARANGGTEEFPELGDPMAGDIAAFAPGETGYNAANLGAPYELDQSYAQSGVPPAGAQVSEVDTARRSGLFFSLRERGEQAASERGVDTADSPARDQMTSPHRLTPPISRRSLHPGAIIPASLITAINSEAPGAVVAQVTQGVYDTATGDRLLIPQGARLIGAYRAATAHGQRRITIIWSRLVMPDGRQIVLDEAAVDAAGDAAGAAGVTGDIDNHWGEVFGAAALGTLINVGAAATEGRNSISVTSGGFGVNSGDDPAEEAAREGVQRAASAVSGRVVERGLAVPPTIRIDAGARISAMVTRELDL